MVVVVVVVVLFCVVGVVFLCCGVAHWRGAGTQGDVLNVHTEGVLNVHTERGVGGRVVVGGVVGGREEGRREGVMVMATLCTTHNTHNTEHARCHRQFYLSKFAHVRLSLDPRGSPFKFENRSGTTCSRFLRSFALPDKVVQLQLS